MNFHSLTPHQREAILRADDAVIRLKAGCYCHALPQNGNRICDNCVAYNRLRELLKIIAELTLGIKTEEK